MEPLVDCIIEDDRWLAFGLEPLAHAAMSAALLDLGLGTEGFTLSVLACNDARITVLNAEFREKPKATNVLSWPSEERGAEVIGEAPEPPEPGELEDPESLGDIAIAYETCMAEAAEQGKTPADHVTHLLIHALLHLLGYDHIEEADARLMEMHEVRILAQMGISDPY